MQQDKESVRIAYVLTLEDDRTLEYAMILSVVSLKALHPDREVVCLTDEATKKLLDAKRSLLLSVVDTWVISENAEGSLRIRSRVIKIGVRRLIAGPYLYLDTDTVIVRSLTELFDSPATLAMAQDQRPSSAVNEFPSWTIPYFESLGWKFPTRKYYNAGIMLAKDCPETRKLAADWEACWRRTCELGLYQDQLAFNHCVDESQIEVQELPRRFNAMLPVDERYRRNAHILHFFKSTESPEGGPEKFRSEYLRLLDEIAQGRAVGGQEVIARMLLPKALVYTHSFRNQFYAGNWAGAFELLMGRISGKLRRSVPGRTGHSTTLK